MISPRLAFAATVLTVALAVPSVVVAAEASSAADTASSRSTSLSSASVGSASQSLRLLPKAKTFKNCTELHKSYPAGVAKVGVKYNTVSSKGKVTHRALKGKVKFDNALYSANKKSDADKDGIACELS